MKILHVLDHSIPLQSGYAFRTRAILEHQHKRGWHTVQVTGSRHYAECPPEERVDGLDFYRTPPIHPLVAKLPVVNQFAAIEALSRRLREVVDRTAPDVLHAHSPALNGIAALRIGRRHGIPVVYECRAFWEDAAVDHGTSTEWGVRYRLTRALETFVFRRSDAVTTICEGLRGEITARGISEDNVTVVPNAVDGAQFAMQCDPDRNLAARLGVAGCTVLGFVGSFYSYEGLSLLVRAMPGILARAPDSRLLLVGGGPQQAELERLTESVGVADKVIFAGRVPHDQVQRYYDLIDVFVYPRLPMRLTELVTPLKPLEAMARKRLVVASDVGGHRELIRSDETGLLFKAGDIAALTDAVGHALVHRERWKAMCEEGQRFVREERSWEEVVARYQGVYARVLATQDAYG